MASSDLRFASASSAWRFAAASARRFASASSAWRFAAASARAAASASRRSEQGLHTMVCGGRLASTGAGTGSRVRLPQAPHFVPNNVDIIASLPRSGPKAVRRRLHRRRLVGLPYLATMCKRKHRTFLEALGSCRLPSPPSSQRPLILPDAGILHVVV
jgi:hypothetical protein